MEVLKQQLQMDPGPIEWKIVFRTPQTHRSPETSGGQRASWCRCFAGQSLVAQTFSPQKRSSQGPVRAGAWSGALSAEHAEALHHGF
jgi:hypothetical protein